MNASERNLLDKSDQMTESMLVRLEDWELAYLRVAMLHEVEESLNAALRCGKDDNSTFANSPARKGGVAPAEVDVLKRATKPRPSGRGYLASELLEAAR